MALNKQVWLNQIKEGFYPDGSFLKYTLDESESVNANRIHIASAGIDPNVIINNITYPIAVVGRVDDDCEIPLDTFSTENTIVRRPEAIEYSYNKVESVVRQHRKTLLKACETKAAHAIAPMQNTTNTPVILTTGETVHGRARLTFDDILRLKERFDAIDAPNEGRILVLHPSHVSDLIREDVTLFKDLTNIVDGEPKQFAGFKVLSFSRMPTYQKLLGEYKKVGYGEEPTEFFCSFAYVKDEVLKADGEIHMYITEDDPKERATIVGFDKRFICMPIRNIAVGAIVSNYVGIVEGSDDDPNVTNDNYTNWNAQGASNGGTSESASDNTSESE